MLMELIVSLPAKYILQFKKFARSSHLMDFFAQQLDCQIYLCAINHNQQ